MSIYELQYKLMQVFAKVKIFAKTSRKMFSEAKKKAVDDNINKE